MRGPFLADAPEPSGASVGLTTPAKSPFLKDDDTKEDSDTERWYTADTPLMPDPSTHTPASCLIC